MAGRLDRRRFLAGAVAAPGLMDQTVWAGDAETEETESAVGTLDLHIHLFGIGDNQSGCRLSKRLTRGLLFPLLLKKLRVRQRAKSVDEGYVLALAELLKGSGLDRGLILAQDAVYDRHGKPDWKRTPVYVPNDYLFRVVGRYPDLMLPCVSINPDRADAVEELQRCFEKGARALKIHPPIQGVDVADKKHTRFFKRCADLEVAVMVHTGHEHSAPVVDVRLASPRKLAPALDQGCTVVACHCGTGWPLDRPNMLPDFLAMVRKYPNLWGDTAVLGSIGRVPDTLRLLADKVAVGRLLHGSDFPFPCHPAAFAHAVGLAKAVALQGIKNPIRRDFALKTALGIGSAAAPWISALVREGTCRVNGGTPFAGPADMPSPPAGRAASRSCSAPGPGEA